MEQSNDRKPAGCAEADQFVLAFEKIAAKSDESMAALRRKIAAPVRDVLYQDLVSTIWIEWQVRPGDVTVGHIADALNRLLHSSDGGVALNRASCEASGIDYDQLNRLLQRARSDELSRGRKVPGIPTPEATTDPAASPGALPPHPRPGTGAAGLILNLPAAAEPAIIREAGIPAIGMGAEGFNSAKQAESTSESGAAKDSAPEVATEVATEVTTRRRRGPKRDFDTASKVAEVVTRLAPDRKWREKLEDICDSLDEAGIRRPRPWKKKGYKTWYDCLSAERGLVVKAIVHHLRRAREIGETFS